MTELITDAIPKPSRISEKNMHVDNNFDSDANKVKKSIPQTEDHKGVDEPTDEPNKTSQKKPRTKLKAKGTDCVINYNIINSNGVKIGSTTNYTVNLNQVSKVGDGLSNDRTSRPMPEIVMKLCERKEEITVNDMLLIKMHMGSGWRDVVRKIGFSDGQIYQFIDKYKVERNEGISEVIYQILLDWKRANTSDATIGKLASVMWSCREYDCVDRLTESYKNLQ